MGGDTCDDLCTALVHCEVNWKVKFTVQHELFPMSMFYL